MQRLSTPMTELPCGEQSVTKMGAEKAGCSGDKNFRDIIDYLSCEITTATDLHAVFHNGVRAFQDELKIVAILQERRVLSGRGDAVASSRAG